MLKNTAGQKIGAQVTTAADGSDFTGSVTCSVTVDAGTRATGSVGSGACTHEGGGYHTYAPSQAETNGDLVAFQFAGSGAITACVQVAPGVAVTAADVADAVWDEATSGHTTAGTFGAQVKTLLDSIASYIDTEIGTIITNIATLSTKLLKYVQLMLRKDSAIATDNATELTAINASGGSGAGAYANTTDALEAATDGDFNATEKASITTAAPTVAAIASAVFNKLAMLDGNKIVDNGDGTATIYDTDGTTPLGTVVLQRTTGVGAVTTAGG